jgi:hypothetical protein
LYSEYQSSADGDQDSQGDEEALTGNHLSASADLSDENGQHVPVAVSNTQTNQRRRVSSRNIRSVGRLEESAESNDENADENEEADMDEAEDEAEEGKLSQNELQIVQRVRAIAVQFYSHIFLC